MSTAVDPKWSPVFAAQAAINAPRRTPDAQADIAAARAAPTARVEHRPYLDGVFGPWRRSDDGGWEKDEPATPTGMEAAFQELDHQVGQALAEARDPPTHFRGPVPANVTAADASAARDRCVDLLAQDAAERAAKHADLDAALSNAALADTPAVREMGYGRGAGPDREAGPMDVILRGPEAERYLAITAAARKAQASAATARADGAALLQLFQAFCAGLAPGKEG